MKKALLIICLITGTLNLKAQQQLAFPFQGGKNVMSNFFKDSLKVSDAIIQRKATGTAVLKFTADEKGSVKKIIVYFADDAILVKPIIDVLRKSDHKWIIPDGEKMHDFILPFSISFNPPATAAAQVQKEFYDYQSKRQPIMSFDQIPLDMATLLPTMFIKYDIAP